MEGARTETSERQTTETTPFATLLIRLSHVVQRVFADVSRERELTPQQVELLCVLSQGPVGMGELSRGLYLEKSSLTGLVDRVERRGLVERVRDSCDRRAWQVRLTGEGEQVATASHDEVTARLERLADDLTDEDRGRLCDAVARIIGAYGW